MTKDEIAISAICNAADKVRELLAGVDEGKIPIRKYLGALVRQLENVAVDLEERCEEWSGS
jgi:hypothetical protein